MVRRENEATIDVYEHLRQEVLAGRFEPGAKLPPAALAKEYGVSLGVVREALTRLTEQELAVSERNRGFQVIEISTDRLEQLLEARQLNECRALVLSIERGDIDWESNVVAAHHRMTNTPVYRVEDEVHSNAEFALAHKTFHFSLLEACANEYLLSTCNRLFDAGELYRRWSVPMLGSRPHAGREHKAILSAALQRDGERAAELYASHIATTSRLVIERFTHADH